MKTDYLGVFGQKGIDSQKLSKPHSRVSIPDYWPTNCFLCEFCGNPSSRFLSRPAYRRTYSTCKLT